MNLHDLYVKVAEKVVGAALANSDRIKVGAATVVGAILSHTCVPALVTKVNVLCGQCIPPDYAAYCGKEVAIGILGLGAMLVKSIGDRDVLPPASAPAPAAPAPAQPAK